MIRAQLDPPHRGASTSLSFHGVDSPQILSTKKLCSGVFPRKAPTAWLGTIYGYIVSDSFLWLVWRFQEFPDIL